MNASKMGIMGDGLRKATQDIDNFTLSTLDHTALYFTVETLMPSNSTYLRKLGIFLGASIGYNLLLSRVQSSESSGMGR